MQTIHRQPCSTSPTSVTRPIECPKPLSAIGAPKVDIGTFHKESTVLTKCVGQADPVAPIWIIREASKAESDQGGTSIVRRQNLCVLGPKPVLHVHIM